MAKNFLQELMERPKENPGFLNPKTLIEKMESGYIADRGPKHTQKKTFSPSTIAYGHGECPRYWYLAFDGGIFEDNALPADVANMTNGTLSHERIQKAIANSGILIDSEFKIISESPPIFGYGDVLLNWEGNEVVGEIKTTRNEVFEYRKKTNKPKAGHVVQLLIYMKVLKKAHELLVIPIEVNDYYIKWVDDAFEWMRTVHKAWQDRELPKKNYRSNSKICKNCPLSKVCAVAEVGSIKIESLEELSEVM
jgi:CRISPR/Cas system-associated exonuclease Cas4 (RecB family)